MASKINVFLIFSLLSVFSIQVYAAEVFCPKGDNPDPNVIWCDGFEDQDLPSSGNLADNYYEFDSDNGDHGRTSTQSIEGDYSLRARWQSGETDAGHFMRNFGRNPIGTQSHGDQDFQDIYWRMYVKYQNGFQGFPNKISRSTIFANSNWAQAMIAHVWVPSTTGIPRDVITLDPASGINQNGELATSSWNDFTGLTWLGMESGTSKLEPGVWYCIEARVKLNTPGLKDGLFELWINDKPEVQMSAIDWRNTWAQYGINSVFISHYWNGAGSPVEQERYLDALVISTSKIGCMVGNDVIAPLPPSNVNAY